MELITNIQDIVIKLKEFELKEELREFIEDEIFNSDSEKFYLNAADNLQIFVNELIFLLESVMYSNIDTDIQNCIKQLETFGFSVTDITEQEYLNDNFVGHIFKVKTASCYILF